MVIMYLLITFMMVILMFYHIIIDFTHFTRSFDTCFNRRPSLRYQKHIQGEPPSFRIIKTEEIQKCN